jgi:hypothetical protein
MFDSVLQQTQPRCFGPPGSGVAAKFFKEVVVHAFRLIELVA